MWQMFCFSNYTYLEQKKLSTLSSAPQNNILWKCLWWPAYLQMMNLHIDKIFLFPNVMKIGTDENKAIYSIS